MPNTASLRAQEVVTQRVAYSMLEALKHVNARAKKLLRSSENLPKKFLFREFVSLVSPGFSTLCESGESDRKVLGAISRLSRVHNSGHSCSGSGHHFPNIACRSVSFTSASRPPGTNCAGVGLRHLACGFSNERNAADFTLVEAMIALGIMVFFTAACLTSIIVSQVSVRKAKEEAIVIDFLTKYTENIKALPFTSLTVGQPINILFSGSPLITIPANGTWVSLNTTAYKTFYPDLLWFNNRNPQMKVTLTKTTVSGALHDIEVNIKVDWDPPISKGGRQEVQVDFLRTMDTSQL